MLGMMAGCAGTHTVLPRIHRQVLWFLNRIYLYYTNGPEKTPDGGTFSALWTINELPPIHFSLLSSTTTTTTTPPHFNVRRKQGQDTKRSQSWNAKGRWVGRGGGRDVVDYSALCVFCEHEIFKHTRKRDRSESGQHQKAPNFDKCEPHN